MEASVDPPTPNGDGAAAEPKKSGGAPVRDYVVFEEVIFEGDETVYYSIVNKVEARNSQNGLRKAARERADFEGDEAEATLSVVPSSMWRPTKVKLSRKSQVSVSIGS